MAVDTREKVFQKNFRQRFPKSTILDIKQCGEKTTTIRVLKKFLEVVSLARNYT